VKQAFKELITVGGDVPVEHLTPKYFKDWYRHCLKKVQDKGLQVNWANRRMRTVKAAFLRCRKESWFGVALPDLDALVAVLQQHGGPQQEQEIFKPAELRSLLKAGELEDRAAILLGLNCAIGNMDMGRLRWKHFNHREIGGNIDSIYEQPRGKNQRKRRTPLWPLTVEILEKWKAEITSGYLRVCTRRSR
jgi:integrase